MVSEVEAAVFDLYFAEIPPHGNLEEYTISRDRFEDTIQNADISQSDLNWLRYFTEEHSNGTTNIQIDTEAFLDSIMDSLEDPEWFVSSPTYERVREEFYEVHLPIKRRGEVTLRVYTDGEEIDRSNPSIFERSLDVWTVEPIEAIDHDYTYSWREIVQEDFIQELSTELDQTFSPTTATLCSLQTPALQKEPEGVEDSVGFFSKLYGFDPDQEPNDVMRSKIFNYLEEENIRKFIQCEDGWAVLCECDIDYGNLHLHFTEDGSLRDIDHCPELETVTEKVREKVKSYNSYIEQKKDIEPAAKTAGYVLGLGGIIEILPIALLVSTFGISPDSGQFVRLILFLGIVYALILAALLWFLLSAHLKFRLHSWEQRGMRDFVGSSVSRLR